MALVGWGISLVFGAVFLARVWPAWLEPGQNQLTVDRYGLAVEPGQFDCDSSHCWLNYRYKNQSSQPVYLDQTGLDWFRLLDSRGRQIEPNQKLAELTPGATLRPNQEEFEVVYFDLPIYNQAYEKALFLGDQLVLFDLL